MTQNVNLYNTGGVPDFVEPQDETEARMRIAELTLSTDSISDQIAVNTAAGTLDPNWLKKASTSRRFKLFEKTRLQNWLIEHKSLSENIVAIVRGDYSDDDWAAILVDAKQRMSNVG